MNCIIDNYRAIERNIINDSLKTYTINQKIEKIYVINLFSDKLRAMYIKILMQKLHINYTLIQVNRLSLSTHNKIIGLTKRGSKVMSVGEAGCYLSHMWCLKTIIINNYKNAIIFEDDIIVHKKFYELFNKLFDNDNNINNDNNDNNDNNKYDFLMLGAADHGINRGNYELINNNIYIPKYNVTMATHAIYYSHHGATTIFNHRLNNPVYFDKNFKELFTFFHLKRTGIAYPNLFTVENSTSNIGHNFGISKYRYNEYYYTECYRDFNFKDYYFIYLDLFAKYILEGERIIDNNNDESLDEFIKRLLANYFNNDLELVDFHFDKLALDFFVLEDIKDLLLSARDADKELYFDKSKEFCRENNITSGILLLRRDMQNLYHKKYCI